MLKEKEWIYEVEEKHVKTPLPELLMELIKTAHNWGWNNDYSLVFKDKRYTVNYDLMNEFDWNNDKAIIKLMSD